MTDEIHELQKMIETLHEREQSAVNDLNNRIWFGSASIEQQIELANGRAVDALLGVLRIAKYIIEKERT